MGFQCCKNRIPPFHNQQDIHSVHLRWKRAFLIIIISLFIKFHNQTASIMWKKKEGKLEGITIATVPGSSRKIPREDEEDKAATSCKQRQLLKRLTLMLLQWRFYQYWAAFSQ